MDETSISLSRAPDQYPDHSSHGFPRGPFLWFVGRIVRRIPVLKRAATELFENIYYDSSESTWQDMNWFGTSCLKFPTDLWMYQEIISSRKPDLIIETGTWHGGSALYIASLLDLIGHGRVVSIDIDARPGRPQHPRIVYLTGSSISPEVIGQLEPLLKDSARRMVILDSDHRKSHVDEELRIYSQYVTRGQYLIVEDTAINGHPVAARFGPGPFESVALFLRGRDDFAVDKTKERFMLSANHNGYLLRCR
jgi:cephalosporin hydroxylase